MEIDLSDYGESHPEVKLDRMMVLDTDMQPGDKAFAAMFSRKMPDKARSMTFAAMCGMCADGTDLVVAVERDTFAAHCDQFAAGSHSIIGAHFARAAAEETRERKVG